MPGAMSSFRRSGWALLVVAVALALAACRPKAGASCSAEGKKTCGGDGALLVCEHGKQAAFACKGPGGCAASGDSASCDVSGNAQSDPCPAGDEGLKLCKPDGKTQLRCQGGHFIEVACVGPGACKTKDDGSSACDRGEPEIGAPCSSISPAVCNLKGDSIYGCSGGKWVVARACRGPHGCKGSDLAGTYCDLGAVADGDWCGTDEQSRVTCGPGRASLYACKDGQFELLAACPSGKTCTYAEGDLSGYPGRGPMVLLPKRAQCQ
jgi:hypothetical protein